MDKGGAWIRTSRQRAFLLFSLIGGLIGLGCPNALLAQQNWVLENPGPDLFQSGIGVISGWVCEAERIEVTFDEMESYRDTQRIPHVRGRAD